MGNSFLKIVRGKEDPDDWKTKVVDNFLGAQQNSVDLDSLKELTALVNDKVTSNKVMVFSKTNCPFCKNAKAALDAQVAASNTRGVEWSSAHRLSARPHCSKNECVSFGTKNRLVVRMGQ